MVHTPIKYAGIGSRQTPQDVLGLMTMLAAQLHSNNCTLRSGHADGADMAFERGQRTPDQMQIFLPWEGFNGAQRHVSWNIHHIPSMAFHVAAHFHPTWSRLSQGVRKLMARNVLQVAGPNLDDPSDCVICWTSDGKASRGTGQAIRVANYANIPVFNLYNENDRLALKTFLSERSLI